MSDATEPGPPLVNQMRQNRFDRRSLMLGASSLLFAGVAGRFCWDYKEAFRRAAVFVAAVPCYEADLEQVIYQGLRELGFTKDWARGKSVMLKPNLVEPRFNAHHISTHPELIRAVVEVFRRLDSREVFVAEGSGNTRDFDIALEESGVGTILDSARIGAVDLNYDDVFVRKNHLRRTSLTQLYLPASLRRADLIVSLPKMKTHHWAGVTLSMKNLFGVLPGNCYGWPKDVFHQVGIAESILDITAALQPHLAIVDGIIGMEGDGPIMGTPKASGVLVMGGNLPAVDATATRLMGINPRQIDYLAAASGLLGPISERHIEQRGEPIAPLVCAFKLPPSA